MKKNNYIALLLALFLMATSVGCSAGVQNVASNKPSDATSDQTVLQEAAEWFKEQTTYYEMISSQVCGDQIVFLTVTKNPGTDDYQNLQAFVVKQNDGACEVTAMKDGERGVSAGFSAHVLATDTLTIVFGDTSSSVYDFSNDRRLDVDFTKINILLAQGETRTEEIAGNAPYLLVFNEKLEIADLEFVDAELNIKYSTFYSENLMENAASDDISNIFSQESDLSEPAVVEVPGEQETIELKEIGLTLILPDSWKGKYALEYDADFKEYYVYNPAIRKAMGGNSETLSSGGMLFYVKVWEEQLTKEQVEAGGEWSFAKCEYITTTQNGTYLLYYASDEQFTPETMDEYRQMESEISDIQFVVGNVTE